MPKLTRSQLKAVRSQLKDARAQEEEEENVLADTVVTEKQLREIKKNLDREPPPPKFTSEAKTEIRKRKAAEGATVTWNIEVGDLVYLPDQTVGMVVKGPKSSTVTKNDMHQVKSKNSLLYKSTLNKVYVVSSKGNSWHRPSSLKPVDQLIIVQH